MSQENLELVRAAYDALNARDAEAVLAGVDHDVEFVSISAALEGGVVFRGRSGIQEYLDGLPDIWSAWGWTITEARAIDDDRVLAVVDFRAVGKGSNVPVAAELAVIYVFRRGLVTRIEAHQSRAAALEAAGLSE